MQKVARILWYLDPHHQKFLARGIHIPSMFESFHGYNDYKRKKEKEPRLSADTLNSYVQDLSECIMQPWLHNKVFAPLKQPVEALVEAMNGYLQYLKHKNSDMKEHHMSPEPFQSNENASLVTLSSRSGPPLSEYVQLEEELRQLPLYSPVCVNSYTPDDKYA